MDFPLRRLFSAATLQKTGGPGASSEVEPIAPEVFGSHATQDNKRLDLTQWSGPGTPCIKTIQDWAPMSFFRSATALPTPLHPPW